MQRISNNADPQQNNFLRKSLDNEAAKLPQVKRKSISLQKSKKSKKGSSFVSRSLYPLLVLLRDTFVASFLSFHGKIELKKPNKKNLKFELFSSFFNFFGRETREAKE